MEILLHLIEYFREITQKLKGMKKVVNQNISHISATPKVQRTILKVSACSSFLMFLLKLLSHDLLQVIWNICSFKTISTRLFANV